MSVRLKRRRAPASLLPAAASKDKAGTAWNERVREVADTLQPAVDTTIAVFAEGVRIAASEGVAEMRIRRAPDVELCVKSKHVWDPSSSNSRA